MNCTYVEDYKSDVSCSSEDDFQPKPKKARRADREWHKIREFQSSEEAEDDVRSLFIWKKSSQKDSMAGRKVEFRCAAGKYRTIECPAGLYLLYHANSMAVSLFETECQHDNHNSDPSRGRSTEIQNFVRSRFEEGLHKPNALLAAIRRKNLPEPSKPKLLAFLKRLRYENFGKPSVSAGEIHAWCSARKQVPSDDDEPFVLDFVVRAETADPNQQDLKIVLSTKRLLRHMKMSAMVLF